MRSAKPVRRKGSEELFNVDWEDDSAVTACFQCDSSFSLLKRKHHCRHCGRVMCADCSVFRYFDVSRKKHRVCSACNQVLARANRHHDSDVESLERSGATGDDGPEQTRASAKPPSRAKKPRGKLRENLKKTFASKDAKAKRPKTTTAAPVSTSAAVESVRVADARSRNPSDDLFDVADDTWFTDPQDNESKSKHAHGREVSDHGSAERHTITTTAAPLNAASWQSKGPQAQPTALSIDVYASRESDVLVQERPARMEMPRPVAHVVPIASTLATREPSAQLRASTYEGDAAFAARPSARASEPAQPTAFTAVRPTFYDANADDLVVDDAPGYYARATTGALGVGERRPTLADTATFGSALLPATVPPRAIVTDSDSYSLVEAPGDSSGSHNVSVASAPAAPATPSSSASPPHDPHARGFTGALKRLFGISGAKSPGKAPASQSHHESSSAGAAPASVSSHDAPRPSVAIEQRLTSDPRRVSSAANVLASQPTDRDFASGVPRVGSFDRYSMAERSFVSSRAAGERYSIAESTSTTFTATGASTVLSSSRGFRHEDAAPSHVATISDTFASREASTRPRRDTFDDLFASPTSKATTQVSGTSALPSRAWDGVRSTSAMPATGVDRFDRARRDEDSDAIDRTPALNGLTPGVYSITRSRSSSIGLGESALGASRVASATADATRAPPTSWRSVTPEANYGVATYAVPSSVETDRFGTSSQVRQDNSASSGASTSIMDDLHRRTDSSAARSNDRTSSVDDIFAAFERPNDYVFDAATGGYVAATPLATTRPFNSVAPQSSQPYEASTRVPEARTERRDDRVERRNDDATPQRRETRAPAVAQDLDDDALDDTIVDKISSLEDELAALKRLIRQRKDHEPTSASAVRRRPTETASSTRKLSIFDHDSNSGEEEEKDRNVRRTSTRRSTRSKATSSAADAAASADSSAAPAAQTTTQRKLKPTKRRDSFADLFEDSPTQGATTLGGGYESLFQTTGAGKDNNNDSSGSSSDENTQRKRLHKSAKRSKASRKTRESASSESDSPTRSYQMPSTTVASTHDYNGNGEEDEEEFPSLKHRSRGSVAARSTASTTLSASRAKKTTTSAGVFSDSDDDDSGAPAASASVTSVRASSVTTTAVARSAPNAPKAKRSDVDAIDALFDDSTDRDVAQFFRDDAQSSETKEEKELHVSPSTQALDVPADALDASDEELNDASPLTKPIATALATPVNETHDDSDEEFAWSLATAKKRRSKTESLQLTTTDAPAPAPSALTALDLFDLSSDVPVDEASVDSDDEFASLLAANRTTSKPPAREATATVAPVTPVSALNHTASRKNDVRTDEARDVQSDRPKASRVKSVSFFDQQSERSIATSETQSNSGGGDRTNNDGDDEVAEAKTLATNAVARDEPATSDVGDAVGAPPAAVPPVTVDVTESLTNEADPVVVSAAAVSDGDLDSSLQHQNAATTPRVSELSAAVAAPAVRLFSGDAESDDVVMGLFDAPSDLYSAALGPFSLPSAAATVGSQSRIDSDDSDIGGHSDDDDGEPAFSFEVQRKPKRVSPPALSLLDLAVPARRPTTDDDDSAVLVLGKYASAPVASPLHHTDLLATNDATDDAAASLSASVDSLELLELSSSSSSVTLPLDDHMTADADWQQLQEQERARRKKLQLKQRQAQRDKLKKQTGGGSSRHVVSSTADASSTSEKKSKSKKSKGSKETRSSPDGALDDDATKRKRSSTSRKHKHKSHHQATSEPSSESVVTEGASTRTEL